MNQTGAELIAQERERQISQEGWTPDLDDTHVCREMAWAAMCYVRHYCQRAWVLDEGDIPNYQSETAPDEWYWDTGWWKPKGKIEDLVRAGALIAAEIDRLQRAKAV